MYSFYRQLKSSSMAVIAITMLAALALLAGIAIPAQAQTETLLHQFTGQPDGGIPFAGPTLKGTTLYGTTSGGGDTSADGVVYQISLKTSQETILHTFSGKANGDGSAPFGGVALDKAGNLYGTTQSGGKYGYGSLYKVTKKGVETVLYSFSGGADGGYPRHVTPVFDAAGNLYGTTQYGGNYQNGTVFKLAADGTLTVIHSFSAVDNNGCNPVSGVIVDKKGNIYGTTPNGGPKDAGTLYKITPAGAYSILYTFTGGADGWIPYSPPVLDKKGNLYGTTKDGGSGPCAWGCGVVYQFNPKTNKETVLHNFNGSTEGLYPWCGALTLDTKGNLYGTTYNAGTYGVGTVYKLAPDRTFTVLFNFNAQPDGATPYGGVALDKAGNVYTTAAYGGTNANQGTVIKIKP